MGNADRSLHLAPNGSPLWRIAELDAAAAPRESAPIATFAEAHGALPTWARSAYLELRDKLLDERFPCTFGTTAQRRGDVLYAFVDGAASAQRNGIRDALLAFTDRLHQLDPVAASLLPLAVLRPLPSQSSLESLFSDGWSLLQWLHEHDPSPWPKHVPHDPNDARWSFCFGAVPLFVTFKTPVHDRRRSRHLSRGALVLFQAREGFDTLAGDTPRGRRARRIIREKLAAYDDVPVSPALGHYGTLGNREWMQYFASDDTEPMASQCPFLHRTRERPI